MSMIERTEDGYVVRYKNAWTTAIVSEQAVRENTEHFAECFAVSLLRARHAHPTRMPGEDHRRFLGRWTHFSEREGKAFELLAARILQDLRAVTAVTHVGLL